MNSYYFITLFVILVVVAVSFTTNKKETFQNAPAFIQPASPVLQKNINNDNLQELQSYTYPSDTLLSPSPGQIASFNSLTFPKVPSPMVF